jgi:hypothetical protein
MNLKIKGVGMDLGPILGFQLPFYLIKRRYPAIIVLSTAVFLAVRA